MQARGPAGALADAHARPASDVAAALELDLGTGLSAVDVPRRREAVGTNELQAVPPPSLLSTVLKAVSEPFVILLFVAGALAVALGEVRDGLLVLVGLLPIVGADVVTSYRGEHALAALRDATAPRARIRRDGVVDDIAAADLVPGDLVLLRTGDVVPADLRVIRSAGLLVDRSVLTGESVPELASIEPDPPAATAPERRSVAFAGTAVVGGHGEGIAFATGPATELGRIAQGLAVTERRRSPLQRELDRLVRILLVVAIGLIVITVGLGFARGNPAGENLIAGISAAIAAIPEEPPILLAVILGLGAYRLLRRGVMVRRLSAEETLGSVDLIITDKTGTLTENRLAVQAVLTPTGVVADAAERRTLLATALRAEEDAWHVVTGAAAGSFTRALLDAADESGDVPRPDPQHLRSGEGPVDGRPYSMTWSASGPDGLDEGLVIGAPEAVLGLPLCDTADAETWSALVEREAAGGGRLLLLARAGASRRWEPLAIVAFADSLRSGVVEAIEMATTAGIQTVVVTGDHPATAITIAGAAGIPAGTAILGKDLATWSDDRLTAELGRLTIVARAVPEDKLRIVDVARLAGRTIAVTGDGVNDAPALQHADVAVAMGSGTAVARDASDLVLGDDSFATLMYGLREGRRIVANVQKGLVFLVSTHVALLGFILVATLVGYSQPLLPIQILWLELFIDLVTSVAFEREPEEPGAMARPPRARGRPLLTRSILTRTAFAGGFTAVAALALMSTHGDSPDHGRWLAYTALVVGQVVRAYGNRSLTQRVTSLRPNVLLGAAAAMVLVVQASIPLIPPLAEAFRATPLDTTEWALVGVIALAPFILAEIVRWMTGREWVA